MDELHFTPLGEPTPAIAEAFTRWENDPLLIPLARPNQSQADLDRRQTVTPDELRERLKHQRIFLIYLGGRLIGEMSYHVDPAHLYRREPGTAWIGISIGEAGARGRGIGGRALRYLEGQIVAEGLGRIELGVFEFNAPAIALYRRLGYREIGRVEGFTYWEGRMWDDIRMEKDVSAAPPA